MPEVSDKAGWICLVLSPDLICHICILQYKVLRAAVGLGLGQIETRFCLVSQICLPNLGVASSRLGSFD